MAKWWNGRHNGLKIRCSKGRVGSSPTFATNLISIDMGKKEKKQEIFPITYFGVEYEVLITEVGLAIRRTDNAIPSPNEVEKLSNYVRDEGLVIEDL